MRAFYAFFSLAFLFRSNDYWKLTHRFKYKYNDAYTLGSEIGNGRTPGYFRFNALSAAQVKDLAAYCADKGMTLRDFLFNKIGFNPAENNDNCYLLTGSQTIKREKGMCFGYCAAPEWDTCKAINMNKVGAKDQTINVWANNSASDKKPCNDITFLCFSVEDDAVATGLVLVKK